MTKLQLHNLAVRANYIYSELVALDKCPLVELWDKVDDIRSRVCNLSCLLDEYDERTAHDFGEGIELED
jgi:hypothetical protein